MESWKECLNKDPTNWLLKGEPWIVYRTLTDLLDVEETNEKILIVQKKVLEHKLIRRILDKRNSYGYWGAPKDIHTWWPRKDTTFWMLGMLGDFGLKVEDDELTKVAEYIFGIQLEDGGFLGFDPKLPYDCHTAILIESLAKIGFLSDHRLQKSYGWILKRQRLDGGWWCKNTGQAEGIREKEASCPFATMFALGAIALNPKLRTSPAIENGVKFLLGCWEKRKIVRYPGHDSQIGAKWFKLKYPYNDYRILKFLDTLSQFKQAKEDPRLQEILSILLSKQDENGCFKAESINKVWKDFDFGQKSVPSKWITLVSLKILKRILSSNYEIAENSVS